MSPDEHRAAMLRGYASMGLDLSRQNIVNRPSGQILVSNGSSSLPQWASMGGLITITNGGTATGIYGRAGKVNKKRRKKMFKFIKFDGELINVCNVNAFRVIKPSNPSTRWSVELDTDNDDFYEYFDSEVLAQARLDEIFTLLQG